MASSGNDAWNGTTVFSFGDENIVVPFPEEAMLAHGETLNGISPLKLVY